MKLNDLTPELIASGPVPMGDLLKDSLYYPASRTDGRPIRLCNTLWRSLGINSFVYCDFDVSETEFLRDTRTVLGYHVLGHRHLSREEYIPSDWRLEMVSSEARPDPMARHQYWDSFLGITDGPAHFAHWVVFERNAGRNEEHGPERFSLLFVCGEGLATFQQLYCSRGLAPKMLCFIQCWGFAGNWTNFTGVGEPFHQTLLKYRECVPEWLCLGDAWHIDGAQRLRGLDDVGVTCCGYHSVDYLRTRFAEPDQVFGEHDRTAWTFPLADRRYVAVSICHQLTPVLYDISGFQGNLEAFLDYIVIRDPSGKRDRRQ